MYNTTKRFAIWVVIIILLLLIPLVLTLLGSGVDGDGWHWTFFDFVFMFTLLFGSACIYELAVKKVKTTTYKVAVGLSIVTGVLLVWINAAVGIIGQGPINLLYFGMLALGFLGALIVRLEPRGMSRVLFTVAIVQALVPVIALCISEPGFAPGVLQVFCLNTIFVILWIGSALLFRHLTVVHS